ncbi:MAG: DUF2135 domain-containing protein [Chitinispirillales bacterium]|jgi:hypothetical protein|nr:DUF2135 domain-containing protein [Chitinispirillales bacterium]
MKSLKWYLVIDAAVILLAVVGLLFIYDQSNVEEPEARRIEEEDSRTAPDMVLPPAKRTALKMDGKGNPDVYLQSLDIRVDVTGNIASTRYTMVFKNKTDRVLEGSLTFPLPDGRGVTYYALDIDGKMREGVPVEKARATEIFEEIERRQVDPGLLEKVAGNNFRTRIYPFLAQGTRTISIGYEEELTLEKESLHYRLPMACSNPLENFSVTATVWKSGLKPIVPKSADELRFDKAGENYVAAFTRENYRPARVLSFSLPAPADIPQVMTQSAHGIRYFFASVAPKTETRKKRWENELAVIWDVSLSASQRDLKRELEALNIIFAEKKNANVHLYFLNNKLKKSVNKNTTNGEYAVNDGNWDGLKSALKTAVFDGGTDFSQIDLNDIMGNEILFFSDGISTLSDAGFLKNAESDRPIHCVISSAKADYSSMRLIAGKTYGKFVNLNALSSEKLKNELLNETPQFLGTEHGKEVREVYPNIATPVHGNFSLSGISDADETELTLLFGFGGNVEKRIPVKLDANNADSLGSVYKLWAQKKSAELDLNYEKNRAELTELGRKFGIVTRNTSLIVLETVDDYILYNITPPASEPDLYAKYQRELKKEETRQHDMLKDATAAAYDIKNWWNADFPLKRPKPEGNVGPTTSNSRNNTRDDGDGNRARVTGFRAFSEAVGGLYDFVANGLYHFFIGRFMMGVSTDFFESLPEERVARLVYAEEVSVALERPSEEEVEDFEQPTLTLKPVKNDNDYLKKLTGKTAEDYQLYLKIRKDYAYSPTFYFDMSDWFHTHGDRETALRVLTSIAELELEDASLYRLLGYRFKEYGEYALEKFVCEKVIQWRPMEPQSYRDYALALADNREAQAALDSLYGLLTKTYSENIGGRSRGIDEVVITEINRLIAKNANLNKSNIDKSVITDIPVDIRVVINWNMNNTDIDLHVKDPNGEECYYGHRKTNIGGRISTDNTNGYGPEQFLLKKAIPGKYRVYVNYYGDRQFTSAGPSTVMAEIFTKYAGAAERRRVVCLQMSNAKRNNNNFVEVADFDF